MLEVMAYLRANGFKTYITSGGGADFMRAFAERVYGIPPEQVIGSVGEVKFEMRDGKPVLIRQAALDFFDDNVFKPVAIQRNIGRRPIAAFGNSDGGPADAAVDMCWFWSAFLPFCSTYGRRARVELRRHAARPS